MSVIFISSPYSDKDFKVVQKRFQQVSKFAAKLVSNRNTAFSPITYGHLLCEFEDMPGDFDFWKDFCLKFLALSDVVYVLKLEGWETSTGVLGEIEFAKENNIPIVYIDYNE